MAKRDLTLRISGDTLTHKLKRELKAWRHRALVLDGAITSHELRRQETFMGPRPEDRSLYRSREMAYDRMQDALKGDEAK